MCSLMKAALCEIWSFRLHLPCTCRLAVECADIHAEAARLPRACPVSLSYSMPSFVGAGDLRPIFIYAQNGSAVEKASGNTRAP